MTHEVAGPRRPEGLTFSERFDKGQFCEPFYFTPKASPDLRMFDQQPDMTPEIQASFTEMLDVFCGNARPRRPFLQLPRQGQRCFLPVDAPSGGFVSAKGSLGCSPGSESVLQLANRRWRSLFGEKAGSLRVEFEEPDINFHVRHIPTEDKKGTLLSMDSSHAEGYSSLFLLSHEYEALRHLYKPLGVSSPAPLALFQRNIVYPWTSDAEAKQKIKEKVIPLLPQNQGEAVFVNYLPILQLYLDSNTGLIVQHFKTLIRPQHYYDLALAGQWDTLRSALVSLEEEHYPFSMSYNLAVAAGKLTENALIHGQLYYDFQNITIAGEICDVDHTVVAPSLNPKLAAKFEAVLQHNREKLGYTAKDTIVNEYEIMLRRVAPDSIAAAKSLAEQSYYLFQAALRSIDISRRAVDGNSTSGTVLSPSEIDSLRNFFITIMVNNMGERGRNIIKTASSQPIDIDTDFRCPQEPHMLKFLLEKQRATILGWTNPQKPFNHFTHPTTQADVDFIIQDYTTFLQTLLKKV